MTAAHENPNGADRPPSACPVKPMLAGSPLRRILRSFGFAAQGIAHVFLTQPNFWVHALAAVLVVAFASWLGTTPAETGVLILAIGVVLAAEMFNTACEAMVDLMSPEYHELARVAKDAAAGAVLICACAAALVGLVVLGPRLLARLFG